MEQWIRPEAPANALHLLGRLARLLEGDRGRPGEILHALAALIEGAVGPERAGLGPAFGLLARWDRGAAQELESEIFGPVQATGGAAWEGWLLWSNPVLPAAELVLPRYASHLDRLDGAAHTILPPPLDPACRLGAHLLFLACLPPPARLPGARSLALRFLLEAPEAPTRRALLTLRVAARGRRRAFPSLPSLLDEATGRADEHRAALLRAAAGRGSAPGVGRDPEAIAPSWLASC